MEAGTPYPRWRYVVPVAFLLIWISRYWYSAKFGLYEDDFARVAPGIEKNWTDLFSLLRFLFGISHTQGRPFHDGFIYLFSHIGSSLAGGLHGVYFIAYLILVANALLFYALLKRLRIAPLFAVAGALAFTLFPADATPAYLTISFGGQPSMTCLLLATHVYMSRCRPISYALIAISLFCYETTVPVFLAVPFLTRQVWDRRFWKEFGIHALILAAIVGASGMLRTALGAQVITTPDLKTVATWPVRQMIAGPAVSLMLFFYRPFEVYRSLEPRHLVFLAPLFVALALILNRARIPARPLGRTALTGLIFLTLAYPLTFTTPAEEIHGRVTRGHMAAAVGGAIVFACFCTAVIQFARLHRSGVLAALAFAFIFTGFIGFALRIQDDYVKSWTYQKAYWTDIVHLCPDLSDGTVILVDEAALMDTKEIFSWGWCLPEILKQLYRFPETWKTPPSVYALRSDWRQVLASHNDIYEAIELKSWKLRRPAAPTFILLEPQGGRLVRREGALATAAKFERHLLYRYLILPEDAPRIRYAWK